MCRKPINVTVEQDLYFQSSVTCFIKKPSSGCRKCDGTTLPPSCAVFTKSGNLNFLETSGPVQACNGIDLPFYYTVMHERGSEGETGEWSG